MPTMKEMLDSQNKINENLAKPKQEQASQPAKKAAPKSKGRKKDASDTEE